MIIGLSGIFFIALLLLLLCAKSIGDNNYGFAAIYLVFCLVVSSVGVGYLVSTHESQEEIKCEELGGVLIDDICYDFKLGPIIDLNIIK